MKALMMDYQLTLDNLLSATAQQFSNTGVVTQKLDKSLVRHSWSEIYTRSKQLAKALIEAGLKKGDRVATLMWNNHAHVEAYYGIPMAQGVYHTLNIRLSPQDIIYISNHGEDRFLIVDDTLLPLYEGIKAYCHFERVFVVQDSGADLPQECIPYEDFLASAGDVSDWEVPKANENDPVGLCYTSGTTGHPKGVLYSHRSMILHSFASCMPNSIGISMYDTVVAVVPQFHVNAWGLPFTCALAGANIVMPGPYLQPEPLLDLFEKEKVTCAAGVPTIWLGILNLLDKEPNRWKLQSQARMVVGGAAAPESIIRGFDRHDLMVVHAWGMTETSPLGTMASLKPAVKDLSEDEIYAYRARQGFAVPFISVRAVGENGEIPWDGKAMGELQIKGPWIASEYYRPENPEEAASKWTEDGYFCTGDVVTINAHGYMLITDRTKDLIKSGGEWISSQELENRLMGHPDIAVAAVVAMEHPKWGERPVAFVKLAEGKTLNPEHLTEYLSAYVAKFWLPDHYVALDEIPKSSTGKFLKTAMRDQLKELNLEIK